MNKFLTLLVMLLASSTLEAQLFKKSDIAPVALSAGAGVFLGLNEGLWAYNPMKGSQFSDPYLSWKNKEHTFVLWSDLNHLTKAAGVGCFIVGGALQFSDLKGAKFWEVTRRIALSTLAYGITHNATLTICRNNAKNN